MENIKEQAYLAAKEIIEKAGLKKGNVLVVGCSTSEVIGNTIGTNSSALVPMISAMAAAQAAPPGVHLLTAFPSSTMLLA